MRVDVHMHRKNDWYIRAIRASGNKAIDALSRVYLRLIKADITEIIYIPRLFIARSGHPRINR